MSCKVLRRGAGTAELVEWNQAAPQKNGNEQPLQYASARLRSPANSSETPGGQKRDHELEAALARVAELERRSVDARSAGFEEGRAAERSASEARLKSSFEKLAASISEAVGIRSRLRLEAEVDTVRLAIAVARRIISRELHTDAAAIEGIVRSALDRLRTQDVSRVVAHPSHEGVLRELLDRNGCTQVQIVVDRARELGAVLFETSRGNLDVSVETQLREIERGLADRLKGRQ